MKLFIKRPRNILIAMLFACVFSLSNTEQVHAQHAIPNFSGKVIDQDTKMPVKDAWVEMKSSKHGGVRYAKTDENGVYIFRNTGKGNDALAERREDGATAPNCMLAPNGSQIANFNAECALSNNGDPALQKYPSCSNCRVYQMENSSPGIPGGRKIMSQEDWGCRSSPYTISVVTGSAAGNPQLQAAKQVLGETDNADQPNLDECENFTFLNTNVAGTYDFSDPNDIKGLCKRGEWKTNSTGSPYLDCYEEYGAEDLTIVCKAEKKNTAKTISPPQSAKIVSNPEKGIGCIAAASCAGTDMNEKDVQCSPKTEAMDENAKRQRIKLSGLQALVQNTPTEEKPVYIVQCRRKGEAYDCSTGSPEVDSELQLKNSGSVQALGLYEENGDTKLPSSKITGPLANVYEWETMMPANGYVYDSYYLIAASQSVQQGGAVGGQQQGKLSFEGSCVEVTDPKGIVFDSHTLEPLSGSQVTLLQKRANGQFTRVANNEIPVSFKNPILTEADGKFSFFVPDGTYKLQPVLKGYTFPYNFTKLNNNFNTFYTNLYKGQELIQKGKIIHTDIPLDPLDKKASEEFAKNNPAKIMTYVQSIDKQNQTLTINGTASHPLSQLSLYSKKQIPGGTTFERGRLLMQAQADKEGKFSITVKLNSLRGTEVIGELDVKKHPNFSFDESGLSSIRNWLSQMFVVHAYQTTSTVQIEPLLNYIEGYAKDEQGEIIPQATVQVRVPMLANPVYEVTTDNAGYFKIPSDKLPSVEYSLAYISPQKGTILLSNNTFIVQNTDTNNVDYYAYKPSDSAQNAFIAKKNNTSQNQSGEVAGVFESRSVMSYVSFIILLLITSAGGLLWMHVARKKSVR